MTENHDLETVKILRADEIGDATVKAVFSEARIVKARVVRELGEVAEHVYAANQRAEETLADARAEAELIRRLAVEEGREQGQSEWAEAVVALEKERHRVVADAESDLLELAVQLAGRIVGRAIELEPSVAAEIVAETLQHVRGDKRITIEVSPGDIEAVQALQADLSATVGGEALVVKANSDVRRGGCIVVSASQRIDARLDTQLSAMRRALEEG